MLNNIYFREYRTKLGFNNQNKIKEFLGAKDITPTVDYQYLTLLNQRLVEIIKKLNLVVVSKILQITFNNEIIRIEIQSGFQNINDIKQHKVLEAQKIKNEHNISSILIHFDLYNGQVAFVKLDNIENDSVHWVTRQQLEGQTVFNINQNYFVWKLTEVPPKYSTLEL